MKLEHAIITIHHSERCVQLLNNKENRISMMIMGIFFETPTLLELEYFMENNQPNHNYQAIIIINIEYETRAVAVR